jgi:hypothetical protein
MPLLGKMVVVDYGKGTADMDITLQGGFNQYEVSVKPGAPLAPSALKNILNMVEEAFDQNFQ